MQMRGVPSALSESSVLKVSLTITRGLSLAWAAAATSKAQIGDSGAFAVEINVCGCRRPRR